MARPPKLTGNYYLDLPLRRRPRYGTPELWFTETRSEHDERLAPWEIVAQEFGSKHQDDDRIFTDTIEELEALDITASEGGLSDGYQLKGVWSRLLSMFWRQAYALWQDLAIGPSDLERYADGDEIIMPPVVIFEDQARLELDFLFIDIKMLASDSAFRPAWMLRDIVEGWWSEVKKTDYHTAVMKIGAFIDGSAIFNAELERRGYHPKGQGKLLAMMRLHGDMKNLKTVAYRVVDRARTDKAKARY